MSNGLAERLNELKNRDEEVQQAVKYVIEDELAETDLIGVQSVMQGNVEGSVKVRLDYGGLEDVLNEIDELDGLDVSIHSGDVHVTPEGNP